MVASRFGGGRYGCRSSWGHGAAARSGLSGIRRTRAGCRIDGGGAGAEITASRGCGDLRWWYRDQGGLLHLREQGQDGGWIDLGL